MAYHLILMPGNIDLINLINFDMDIAINFLKDVITNGVAESFLFMIENDSTIASTVFEENRNIFHIVKS